MSQTETSYGGDVQPDNGSGPGTLDSVGELYHLYRERLFAFVLQRMQGDEEVAEDIVQETFLGALNGLARFRGDSQLYTWLCSIATNKIRDYYRVQAREAGPHEHYWLERAEGGHEPTEPSEEGQHVETGETHHTVRQAMDMLRGDYKEVLSLKYFEGLEVSEISRTMNRSEKSVEGLLSRARKALRLSLAGR
jgi:RNA polymerase sigma-70 factor (ECF subfamily)